MQGREFRSAVLIALLLVGGSLYAAMGEPSPTAPQRWPRNEDLFNIERWVSGPETVEVVNGSTYVSRALHGPDGTQATLTLVTNQNVKVFAAGAEVPFLGSGYDVGPASSDLMLSAPGRQELVAQRGSERWLVIYTYGERRGLLGNGPVGWGLALFDGLLGSSNDYYKLYLTVPLTSYEAAATARQSAALADTLFPRIANWYSA